MEPEREVVRRVLDVHRAHLLEQARSVHVSFSSGGLAFRAKGQPTALLEAEAVLVPGRQEISVRGRHPSPWGVAIRDSHELKRRLDALHTGWRLLRWTPEDVGVFAAGALWTYVMLPLLLRDARHVRVRRSDAQGDEVVLQLDEGVAGHAPHHVVRVDPAGRIVRHDYTATAFGRWARAAQTIEGYRAGATVPFGTDRRVTPRLGRRRLPGPTLVWIHVRDIALDQDQSGRH